MTDKQPKSISDHLANSKTNGTDLKTLQGRADEAAERCKSFLINTIDAGWWPYKAHGGPSLEATAWCSLALKEEKKIASACLAFFTSSQNADGGWPTAPNTGASCWVSGPVLLAMRCAAQIHGEIEKPEQINTAITKSFDYLTANRSEFYSPAARLILLIGGLITKKGTSTLDYARGWPWDPNCFHWVEPTSYNLLALKVPGLPKMNYTNDVIKFANQFLTDNSCLNGGWNHGSHRSLGKDLPPYRVTTAEALLALQDLPDHPVIPSGIKYLTSQRNDDSSSMSLAWSILALHAFQKGFTTELGFLLDRQQEDGSFSDNFMVNGLSLCALQAALDKSPLKVAAKGSI